MNKISESFLGYDVNDEDHYRDVLTKLIEKKEIPDFPKFSKESKSKRDARVKRVSTLNFFIFFLDVVMLCMYIYVNFNYKILFILNSY